MTKIKLIKTGVKRAQSMYLETDIVYYKEEKDDMAKYRLTRIINEEFLEMSKCFGLGITVLSTLGYYAPDIIEGEIVKNNGTDIHIKDGDSVYVVNKDAESFKFSDVSND